MAPARLGPYVLDDAIATHGLIATYRARHEQLGRRVLVKTLKPTVSGTSPFAQELDREARILATLNHDAILTLLELVRTGDAIGLVLEDPGGYRLSDVLAKARRLEPDVAAAIALSIARGLGHAHARGVVHRDLRPERVLVLPTGMVKIADFGAAHAERLPSLPEPFEGDGTFRPPDYMAPELLVGEPARAPSDVFTLGVVLFEMLSGSLPFAAPDAKDVARRIRNAPPAPLGDVAVPRALERVLARCLAKEPDDRYPDADELVAALERALDEGEHPPVRVLVSRALAAAGLGAELPVSGTQLHRLREAPTSIAKPVRALLVVGALVVAGGAAIEFLDRPDDDTPTATTVEAHAPSSEARGYLRVLAKPWAEVLVDGELVDTTPVGRAIAIAPGRHYVTFRHPNAADEKRTIKVSAGQTVVLDVTMHIERPPWMRAPRPSTARRKAIHKAARAASPG